MSDLTKLIEQFFVIEKGHHKKIMDDAYFLDVLIDRKLGKVFQQSFRKITKELEETPIRNAEFFLKEYLIYNTAVRFQLAQQSRKSNRNHQIVTDTLDKFYFIQKLQYSCSMLNNRTIVPEDFQINYLDQIQQNLDNQPIEDEPCLEVFHLNSKMLSNETEEKHFQELKKFIFNRIEKITPEDGRYTYLSVINYCARRAREGKRTYMDEALNLYLHGIENEVLFEGGRLSPWIFKNIINLSLSLNLRSHEWVENFILQYSPKLPESFQDNALHYNLAFLFYSQKDYDKAIFHLNQTQFTDIFYNLGSKAILMQIYYELREDDALLSLIASFSLFLKRNKKISRSVKLPYLNFCSILNKIMRRNPKR